MKNTLIVTILSLFLFSFGMPKKSPKIKSPYRKLFVAARMVDCRGDGKEKCFLVKSSPEKSWEYFSESIEGFDHESGFEYQILVEIADLPDETADGFSTKYVLRRVIAKTASGKPTETVAKPEIKSTKSVATEWVLTDFIEKNSGREAKGFEATLVMDFAGKKIYGQGPCNKFSGSLRDLEKNRVRFENIGSTRMACENSDKERTFLSLLPLTRKFVIEGDRMYIYHGPELIMAFKRK
jgi:heat shock protein HslJ